MTQMKYTKDHQWLRLENDGTAVVGITDYAQEQLGDVVFVELPAVGTEIARDAQAAQVESVKSAGDVMAPVAGTVVDTNTALDADPAIVNTDPTGAGWFFKLKLADPSEANGLLDEAAYRSYVESLG